MTRCGWNLSSDIADPQLSETSNKQRVFADDAGQNSSWSSYLMLGGRVTGVAHDITLDGPVFHDYDTGVEKENFIGEAFAGIGFRFKRVDIGYVHTWGSDAFKTQENITSYGSLRVSYSY